MSAVDEFLAGLPRKSKSSSTGGGSDLVYAMANLREVLDALPNSRDELERIVARAQAALEQVEDRIRNVEIELRTDLERKVRSVVAPISSAVDSTVDMRVKEALAPLTSDVDGRLRRAIEPLLEDQRAARELLDELAETEAEISRRLLEVETAEIPTPEAPDVSGLVRGQIETLIEQWRKEADSLAKRISDLGESFDTRFRKIPTMVSAPPMPIPLYVDGEKVTEARQLDFPDATITKDGQRARVDLSGTFVPRLGGSSGTVAPLPFFNVKDYGALGDNSTDDTLAIQAAIDAASTAGGGTVIVPVGRFVVSNLQLKSFVILAGMGMGDRNSPTKGSVLVHKPQGGSTNVAVLSLASVNENMVTVRDLTIMGNRSNHTGSGRYDGIYFDNTGGTGYQFGADTEHRFQHVQIRDCSGHGLYLEGGASTTSRANRLQDVLVGNVTLTGIYLNRSSDCVLTDSVVKNAGQYGFQFAGGNTQAVNCKAYYCGDIINGINGTPGDGFFISSTRCSLNSCHSQDNKRHGFNVTGSYCTFSSCVADSNNWNQDDGSPGKSSGGGNNGVGFYLNGATYCIVHGLCTDRHSPTSQEYAVTLTGSAANNRVDMASFNQNLGNIGGTDYNATIWNLVQINGVPNDPTALGVVATFAPNTQPGTQAWTAANAGRYIRCLTGGVISKVGFHVGTASGNVSVGVFSPSGVGRDAVPGTMKGSSGAVACPAAGYAEVSLSASVRVEPGDFLALSCDNTTATFLGISGADSNLYKGYTYGASSQHPLASNPSSPTATVGRMPFLVGVR